MVRNLYNVAAGPKRTRPSAPDRVGMHVACEHNTASPRDPAQLLQARGRISHAEGADRHIRAAVLERKTVHIRHDGRRSRVIQHFAAEIYGHGASAALLAE